MNSMGRYTRVCVTLRCPCIVRKPTYNKWADPMPALSFCPCLPCLLLCLSVHRRLSIPTSALLFERPAPTAARAPQHHHHHCCVTKEQKRECQTPPTRSLSHQSPHLSSRWGCLFSGFLSTPRVLQNGRPPPPGAHYSAAPHPPAPPPRARGQGTSPLYPTPAGSPIKIINHFFPGFCFQDITPPAVKTLTTLTPKKEGRNL